jgi:hypothetical protein
MTMEPDQAGVLPRCAHGRHRHLSRGNAACGRLGPYVQPGSATPWSFLRRTPVTMLAAACLAHGSINLGILAQRLLSLLRIPAVPPRQSWRRRGQLPGIALRGHLGRAERRRTVSVAPSPMAAPGSGGSIYCPAPGHPPASSSGSRPSGSGGTESFFLASSMSLS